MSTEHWNMNALEPAMTHEQIMERAKPKYYDMDTKELSDHMEWARYCESLGFDRQLAHDTIGKYRISTMFMGIDMGMFNMYPLIFETMIFCDSDSGDPLDCWMDRYTWRQQAMDGHENALRLVRGEISLEQASGY